MRIADYIRDIQDFPKEGVGFKDITPLLNDHAAMMEATKQLLALVGDKKVDRVVGMESRGYFFATLLAEKLGAGFVPVRKPGKLPFDTISQEYSLEYGTDILEMHVDAIKPGEKVLIHDDVLATGGTAEAVCKLVERLGGEIVQVNFLMELSFLHGRDKLAQYEVKSLMSY
ncbi:adenine phosphoribosyltransferase [Myroides marinus]|jgi:adenine phosphoribosyltransferase|uniref:Adenine phosphoribosyltransferase n=1 Tax=Myroides marinus TaxID=703342 RepID=A0A161SID0_9FLAO|nr:adenine phosphoribosyltransferase [Myroides marinus]KUF44743.1 adenine phosphoribosyltransferase [Myroides marinus]KZE81385.1 adenine phosphoribosyltransferase [Myroides marinus]MDM1348009.1 adenine phosphoribosyltransferase [Myroides marinus]MDM1350742.1 adenine phosphoribosyltransferase [Myroides marinus]MDM1354530.1 adenine phosphoribosyltransferase [Myroides marinus]